MKICVPVIEDRGLESEMSAHFGSAPLFLVVDSETAEVRAIPNRDVHHGHGMCRPLASLAGERIDGVVVGGIGRGALAKLRAASISVYLGDRPTVGEAIAAFRSGELREVTPESACAHHGHGHEAGAGGGGGGRGRCHGEDRGANRG